MKNLIFEDRYDLVIFNDSECETDFYGMDKETLVEKMKIMKDYNYCMSSIPKSIKLKVCKIRLYETSNNSTFICKPIRNAIVEFPVKRIINCWVQIK